MESGNFYFIKDEYYETFNDPYLMRGHGDANDRPCYYSFTDDNSPLIRWMIPISHQVNKFQHIYNHKIDRYGSCDTIVFGDVLGQRRAFLIQNMCPVTDEYIDTVYINHGHIVTLDGRLKRDLSIKSRKVLAIQERNEHAHIIFPNIFRIKNELLLHHI